MGIRFGTAGGPTTTGYTGGLVQAEDPYMFKFKPKNEAAFRDLAQTIEIVMQSAAENSYPGIDGLAGQLQALADLRTQGVLTEDEFVAAKARLLN
ncbi:MAG: SHOCT domain-containing protein [Actinobacteria bacterium]|nr:SHOCT domain-containing protein [Actinomycetota bacterium]